MHISRSIGANIKKLRTQNGMTQDALADALFVTRQTISNYEVGKSCPSLDILQKMSEVFGVDIHIILYGEQPSEERQLVGKRTVIAFGAFLCLLLSTAVLYPLTDAMRKVGHSNMPHILVRVLLVPALLLALGWVLMQAIEYFFGFKQNPMQLRLVPRCVVFGVFIGHLAIVLPYVIWLMVLSVQLLFHMEVAAVVFPKIPVYEDIARAVLAMMYHFPYIYTGFGILLWLFFPRKQE